jgi:hypothetical protein
VPLVPIVVCACMLVLVLVSSARLNNDMRSRFFFMLACLRFKLSRESVEADADIIPVDFLDDDDAADGTCSMFNCCSSSDTDIVDVSTDSGTCLYIT